MSDLVGKPHFWFSHANAQFILQLQDSQHAVTGSLCTTQLHRVSSYSHYHESCYTRLVGGWTMWKHSVTDRVVKETHASYDDVRVPPISGR